MHLELGTPASTLPHLHKYSLADRHIIIHINYVFSYACLAKHISSYNNNITHMIVPESLYYHLVFPNSPSAYLGVSSIVHKCHIFPSSCQ